MTPEVPPGVDTAVDPDPTEWQRLDARNLLLDPVKAIGQFLVPALIAFVGLSTSRDDGNDLAHVSSLVRIR